MVVFLTCFCAEFRMPRFVVSLLSVLCACCCGSVVFAADAEDAPRLLRIGYTHFAPFVYVDDNGKLAGIDVELAQAACERLNCRPLFIPINWHHKKELLTEGRVDCIWTVFSMNGREKTYRWTTPYLKSRQVVMVADANSIHSLNELADRRIATTHDSKAEELILTENRLKVPVEIYSFSQIDEAFTCMSEGFADAIASHEGVLNYFARHSDKNWRLLPEELAVVDVGVAFARSADNDRVNALSRTLTQLRENGTLAAILKKYDYIEPSSPSAY